jgi:hypothetical protein
MADYYSINELKKPSGERRYHSESNCPPGSEINNKNHRNGRPSGSTLCEKCKQIKKAK